MGNEGAEQTEVERNADCYKQWRKQTFVDENL